MRRTGQERRTAGVSALVGRKVGDLCAATLETALAVILVGVSVAVEGDVVGRTRMHESGGRG